MISMAQAPPVLSKYTLIEEIGHGGMATVYRARDTRLDREVALKLIHRHLRQNEEVEARFASEARVVAKLRHPNIVEVFDVSDDEEDERFLIVELIRGPTLRGLLTKHKTLPVELAAEVVQELASALEHAHELGVIHRDIKPENVLIESPPRDAADRSDELAKPRVKLTDFGIAKLLDAQGVTSTGQVLGSPAHMAPEQIEGKPVDRRADVFSLGVLFYEAIVGALPFAGKNPAQVLRNVLEGNFEPPDRVRPEIGTRWSAIVTKALSRDPDGRFDTIQDFGNAVRAELARVEFQDARADITRFLVDPEGYAVEFKERIVRGLGKSGRRARAARDRGLATCQFSRALAYKPGDPTLLRQVSGLRRDELLRRTARYAAFAGAGLAALGFAIVFWPESVAPRAAPTEGGPAPTARAAHADAKPVRTTPTSASPRTTPPNEGERKKREGVKRPPLEVDPTATRTVSVKLTGVLGGSLRIDGEPKPWFGVTHELTVGDHTFEFIPPNDNCCRSLKQTVAIKPGDGIQEVRGRIPFKDAVLQATDPMLRGMKLLCPALFPGALALPGERSVVMSEEQWSGICTLVSGSESADRHQKSLTLRAGDTTVLTWP